LGKWELESSENVDEYLKALEVDLLMRGMVSQAKPIDTFIAEPNGEYILRSDTKMKTKEMKFRLDEEFDETTLDGRNVKTTCRLDGTKLIQDQKGEVPSVITREVTDPNTLVTTFTAVGVTCTRVFKRA